MQDGNSLPTGWVKLNVGGQVFQTTRQTLYREPDGFLARLVADDERVPSAKDENGAYLIDRDPDNFPVILSYLRHGTLKAGGDMNKEELTEEAEFYNLPVLAGLLEDAKYETNMDRVIVTRDDKEQFLWVITGDADSNHPVARDLRVLHHQDIAGENGAYHILLW